MQRGHQSTIIGNDFRALPHSCARKIEPCFVELRAGRVGKAGRESVELECDIATCEIFIAGGFFMADSAAMREGLHRNMIVGQAIVVNARGNLAVIGNNILAAGFADADIERVEQRAIVLPDQRIHFYGVQ